MIKKKYLCLALGLCMIMCISVFTVSASTREKNIDQNSLLYCAGQIDQHRNKNTFTTASNEIYAVGKNVTIYKNEVDKIVEKDQLFNLNRSESEENALNYLVKRDTLYNAAKKGGFLLSDADVDLEINKLKNIYKNAINYSDLKIYLTGRGIIEDEYWIEEFENIKRDCTIHDYLVDLQNKYAKDNNIKEWSEKTINNWKDFKDEFITNLIINENVVVQ